VGLFECLKVPYGQIVYFPSSHAIRSFDGGTIAARIKGSSSSLPFGL